MDFKQSETKKNLMRAFAGESQARNRYIFAAAQAKEQKMQVVEFVFRFTAKQEEAHAAVFYQHLKELSGETVHIDGGYPVDIYESVSELCVRQSITNMKNLTRCIRRLGIRHWRRAFRRWQHRLPRRPLAGGYRQWQYRFRYADGHRQGPHRPGGDHRRPDH